MAPGVLAASSSAQVPLRPLLLLLVFLLSLPPLPTPPPPLPPPPAHVFLRSLSILSVFLLGRRGTASGGCGRRCRRGLWRPPLVGREHGVGNVGVCVGDAVVLVPGVLEPHGDIGVAVFFRFPLQVSFSAGGVMVGCMGWFCIWNTLFTLIQEEEMDLVVVVVASAVPHGRGRFRLLIYPLNRHWFNSEL